MQRLLFHFIGICSTAGLLAAGALGVSYLATGEGRAAEFFEPYRGAEPFIIFLFPVVLAGSAAWIWDLVRRLKN